MATARGEREDKLLLKLSEEVDDVNLWRSKDRLLGSEIKRCRFAAEPDESDEDERESLRAERKKNLLQARERRRAALSMAG